MVAINLAICTCKRVQLLRQCLESIARAKIPAGTSLIVTIIDNDAEQSALQQADEMAPGFPVPLQYFAEPRRGIPCARNRAIAQAHALNADYLVFIDDDEWVTTEWLVRLYEYGVSRGGRVVVSGAVISELPAETPAHIRAIFATRDVFTGERLQVCATNNVLIPIHVTRDLGLRFDESDPLAGGTDTIFFAEAVARGVEIYRCAEAVVHELVPASRITLRWLAKRKYRAGITEAWRKQQKGRGRPAIFISAAIVVLIESIKSGVMALLGNASARTRFWLKACKYAGVAAGAVGKKVDSYRVIDGF